MRDGEGRGSRTEPHRQRDLPRRRGRGCGSSRDRSTTATRARRWCIRARSFAPSRFAYTSTFGISSATTIWAASSGSYTPPDTKSRGRQASREPAIRLRQCHGVGFPAWLLWPAPDFHGNLTHDELLKAPPTAETRFVVYDLVLATADGTRKDKIVLISWCPESAKVEQRSAHSTTRNTVRNLLDGVQVYVQATDLSDVEYDELVSRTLPPHGTRGHRPAGQPSPCPESSFAALNRTD
ncbi:cofilin family protein [Streptomyces sp. NPDC004044]